MNNIVKKILDKFDSGENLNEEEIRKLLEYELEEFRYEGENRRWSRGITSICQIGNRYFSVNWEEGLTEYQPDGHFEQPFEVEKIDRRIYKIETTFEEIK